MRIGNHFLCNCIPLVGHFSRKRKSERGFHGTLFPPFQPPSLKSKVSVSLSSSEQFFNEFDESLADRDRRNDDESEQTQEIKLGKCYPLIIFAEISQFTILKWKIYKNNPRIWPNWQIIPYIFNFNKLNTQTFKHITIWTPGDSPFM